MQNIEHMKHNEQISIEEANETYAAVLEQDINAYFVIATKHAPVLDPFRMTDYENRTFSQLERALMLIKRNKLTEADLLILGVSSFIQSLN